MSDAERHLELAKEQLERVLAAWPDPTDWSDLTIYGFYCLENGVMAAAAHVGLKVRPMHNAKAEAASKLAKSHGLPDISMLLQTLNAARKATSYGDVVLPSLDAEDLAGEIEEYIRHVTKLIDS
ncbi:MAG TPA: hypothetical protein VFJ82_03345 [Longimicrobium sp.]|nr:hypothetical protein [Longimicrobium sp.]